VSRSMGVWWWQVSQCVTVKRVKAWTVTVWEWVSCVLRHCVSVSCLRVCRRLCWLRVRCRWCYTRVIVCCGRRDFCDGWWREWCCGLFVRSNESCKDTRTIKSFSWHPLGKRHGMACKLNVVLDLACIIDSHIVNAFNGLTFITINSYRWFALKRSRRRSRLLCRRRRRIWWR